MTCARKRLAQAGEDANPTAQTMLALQRLSSIVEHDQHWSLACACSHTLLSRPPSFPSYSHTLSLPLRVLACGMSLLCIPKKNETTMVYVAWYVCVPACLCSYAHSCTEPVLQHVLSHRVLSRDAKQMETHTHTHTHTHTQAGDAYTTAFPGMAHAALHFRRPNTARLGELGRVGIAFGTTAQAGGSGSAAHAAAAARQAPVATHRPDAQAALSVCAPRAGIRRKHRRDRHARARAPAAGSHSANGSCPRQSQVAQRRGVARPDAGFQG